MIPKWMVFAVGGIGAATATIHPKLKTIVKIREPLYQTYFSKMVISPLCAFITCNGL